MEEAASPRPDNVERFLAMGGGSFDVLLEMIGGAQAETAAQARTPAWLPQGYLLEYDPDALILRRVDSTFVAAFSSRGAAGEAIVRAVEEDLKGWPAYCGPERYAGSARRLIEARTRHSWERFLQTERRALEARRKGRMAKALSWRLPGESQKDLDRIASEDLRRAEEGLVELSNAHSELSLKHVEELSPDDRMDRIRAELARIEWLMERHEKRSVMQAAFFKDYQPRRSVS